MKTSMFVRYLFIFGFLAGVHCSAIAEVTSLNRGELSKVEAVLAKDLKGKPVVKSGEKEELDGGWKITCVADIGSGGEYILVLTTEKSMTLGTVVSQSPGTAAVPKKG